MTVYVDAILPCVKNKNWPYPKSSHLIADTHDELLEFADLLGLSWSWLQTSSRVEHFDITENKRAAALRLGAVEIDQKTFVSKLKGVRRHDRIKKPTSDIYIIPLV